MQELKNCPHCGSETLLITKKLGCGVCIMCDFCRHQTNWLSSMAEATTNWNTTENEPTPPASEISSKT